MQAGYASTFRAVGGFNIFTAEHVPLRPKGTALLVAPFLEERLFCRPVLRTLADALMDAGWHTLRFDTPGEGDSDGELTRVGLSEARQQLEEMAALLREATEGPLVLVGFRWGASLALAEAGRIGADAVIAVEPLPVGEDYLQQLLRQNLTTQMSTWGRVREDRETLLARSAAGEPVNVQGFDLGPKLVSELRTFRVPRDYGDARVALIRCALNGDDPPPAWRQLVASEGVEYERVPVRPFWYEPRQYDAVQPALQEAVLSRIEGWFR